MRDVVLLETSTTLRKKGTGVNSPPEPAYSNHLDKKEKKNYGCSVGHAHNCSCLAHKQQQHVVQRLALTESRGESHVTRVLNDADEIAGRRASLQKDEEPSQRHDAVSERQWWHHHLSCVRHTRTHSACVCAFETIRGAPCSSGLLRCLFLGLFETFDEGL